MARKRVQWGRMKDGECNSKCGRFCILKLKVPRNITVYALYDDRQVGRFPKLEDAKRFADKIPRRRVRTSNARRRLPPGAYIVSCDVDPRGNIVVSWVSKRTRRPPTRGDWQDAPPDTGLKFQDILTKGSS